MARYVGGDNYEALVGRLERTARQYDRLARRSRSLVEEQRIRTNVPHRRDPVIGSGTPPSQTRRRSRSRSRSRSRQESSLRSLARGRYTPSTEEREYAYSAPPIKQEPLEEQGIYYAEEPPEEENDGDGDVQGYQSEYANEPEEPFYEEEPAVSSSARNRDSPPSGGPSLALVPKRIQLGARGGAYYVNSRGRKVWLKRNQREACRNGTLRGAVGDCPTNIRTYNVRQRDPNVHITRYSGY